MPPFTLLRHGLLLLAAALLLAVVQVGNALQFNEGAVTQYARTKYGERVANKVSKWVQMMNQVASKPERQQLSDVNNFWNFNVRGDEDIRIWGKTDYWATPLETLSKGAADCEDFVIAKYFSLVKAGVNPDKLRFIYVKANVSGVTIAHMVLGYYETADAVPLILDNLSGSITSANNRRDLTPVFSFNANGVYVPGAAVRSVDRIGHWRDLLERMQQEGFQP